MDPPPENMLRRLPGILAYVLHADTFLATAALALCFALLEWVGRLPGGVYLLAFPLARVCWGTFFFLVARKASIGSRRLPVPQDFLDTWEALVLPLTRALLSTSWCWLLLLLQVHLSMGLVKFMELQRADPLSYLQQSGPVGALLLVSGMLYLSVALLAALVSRRVLPLLHPGFGFRLILPVLPAFVVMFIMLHLLSLAGFTISTASVLLQAALPIPLAASVTGHLIRLWAPLAQARLLGEFVYFNRAALRGKDPYFTGPDAVLSRQNPSAL